MPERGVATLDSKIYNKGSLHKRVTKSHKNKRHKATKEIFEEAKWIRLSWKELRPKNMIKIDDTQNET